jgi:hypothetical protein
MKRQANACRSVVVLVFLLIGSSCLANDDDASTGTILAGDIVTTIAEAWGLALQIVMRRSRSRNALQAGIERETVEATRRFGTVRCSAIPDHEHDPLALLAKRRIDVAVASLRDRLSITYQSICIGGRLAVTFDVEPIDIPR